MISEGTNLKMRHCIMVKNRPQRRDVALQRLGLSQFFIASKDVALQRLYVKSCKINILTKNMSPLRHQAKGMTEGVST